MGWPLARRPAASGSTLIQEEYPLASPLSTPPPPNPSTACTAAKRSSTTRVVTTTVCPTAPCTKVIELAVKAACCSRRILLSLCILTIILGIMFWLSATYVPPHSDPGSGTNHDPTDSREHHWMQYNGGSMSHLAQTCHNGLGETSQNNFFQQRQPQACNQPTQQGQRTGTFSNNQQSPCFQNQPAYQSDPYTNSQQVSNQPITNPFQPNSQMSSNPQQLPQTQFTYTGTLPPSILDQIRACMAPSPGPIFILPSNPFPMSQQPQQTPQTMSQQPFSCPGIKYPCNSSQYCCQQSCFPFSLPMQFINPFIMPPSSSKETSNCSCCAKKSPESKKMLTNESSEYHIHQCVETNDKTICAKKNCPASINLQALASQLLSVPGVISCAVTRLVLRKLPGSNITNSTEETVERAKNAIDVLSQEQLLAEIRSAQQVNALINLHMTASPPASIIPVLTAIQLKINSLKNYVDDLINRRLNECQGAGAEGSGQLDSMMLSLKTDEELRTLLATLRQKECDERVNFSFSPYHSQRVIAENRLRNVENKINQVETEMERRRSAMISGRMRRDFGGNSGAWHTYPGTIPSLGLIGRETAIPPQTYESPDPFQIRVPNPRKLNLKPHVGSPETTYRMSEEVGNVTFEKRDPGGDRRPASLCSFSVLKGEDEKKVIFKVENTGPSTNGPGNNSVPSQTIQYTSEPSGEKLELENSSRSHKQRYEHMR